MTDLAKKDSKKKMIIEAATKIFAEKGYQYATISEIAKESGISTGLVYSYFENKLDVLFSVIMLFWQKINQTIRENLMHLEDPVVKLKAVFLTFHKRLLSG